jgi:hypothetical protein
MSANRIIRRKIVEIATELNTEAMRKNIGYEDKTQVETLVKFYNQKFITWCRQNIKLKPNEKAFINYINLCR